ncbi:MAG: 4'-phosphopantetheinyl transferase superfamily protein [Cyanobacteria bacterium J06626_18]
MNLTLPNSSETHVWQLHIPDFRSELDGWFQWLSVDERDRAQRFFKPEDRERFILSRGGLRYLLASYLDCAPKSLLFAYSDYGKPSLADPCPVLQFNLAHSGSWVVYAVGQQALLGVDVEQINPRTRLDGLIERCLTSNEQATLPVAHAARLEGFFQHWTVKEAHLKAIGLGLSYPMTDVEIAWHPDPTLVIPAKIDTAPTPWTVKLWYPTDDAIAAVCTGRSHSQVVIRSFPVIQ